MKKILTTLLIMSAIVIFMTGCGNKGPKVVSVNGTITKNGKPLTDVRLEFSKADTGAKSFGEADAEGKFTLIHTHGKSGAEPGKYTVLVFQKGKPIPVPAKYASMKSEDIPAEIRDAKTPEVLLTTSDKKPIEVEITESGENNIVIDLK